MKIITIDREFGAGGHSVGNEVARRLGIELYDRDIIRQAAQTSGITAAEMEHQEEALSLGESIISAIVPNSYDIKDIVFDNERQAIVNLAKQGPCVIIGRCASAILAEEGIDSLDVFLYASKEARCARVGELTGLTHEADIMSAMKKRDSERRSYFEHYTSRHWGMGKDYDLFLNTGTLGRECCIDIVCRAAAE